MADEILTGKQPELAPLGLSGLPALVAAAGERASYRFVEFFTANIRNPHTRQAYARAVREFCAWCEDRGLQLERLNSVHVSGYVELLGQSMETGGRGATRSRP